jgi:uncharacterized Zn finger protein
MQWAPYVPVAERRKKAAGAMQKRAKSGLVVEPVVIEGRTIARSAWGKRWCDALEGQADFANRLPRGRTYARNGSVVHLGIAKGELTAVVSGSELYDVRITIAPLPDAKWKAVRKECAGKVGSALALLQGKLSDKVMDVIARPGTGLIPVPGEVRFRCSCPDSASLCKHCAAVLYGVGARLDTKPEMLFTLRGVSHLDLVDEASVDIAPKRGASAAMQADDAMLSSIFGIDLGGAPAPTTKKATTTKKAAVAPAARKAASAKKTAATVVVAPVAKKTAATAVVAPVAKKAASAKKTAAPAPELTMADLRAMGHSAARVKALVADGSIERVAFGWYRFTR